MESKRSRSHADMNFSVIKRYVPSLQQILAIAASASVYILTPDNSETGAEWKRADIEGTLFVCELGYDAGRHCIIILNRKGRDNLIIQAEEIENVEITAEFLTLRFNSNGEARILGFFLQCSMCSVEEICALIKGHWEIAKQSQGYAGNIYDDSEVEIIGQKTEYKPIGLRLSFSELFGNR